MPLYEYQCDACGARFERIQKFSDAPIAVCPTCGGAVRKLISSPAIQFKGSGFYITDYAKSGAGDSDKSEKSDKSDKAAAATSKTSTTEAAAGGETGSSTSTSSSTTSSGEAAGSKPAPPKADTPPTKS